MPLVAVEGTAYDCGRHYAEIVLEKYPGFREYLDLAHQWKDLTPLEKRLVEERAPHLFDVYRGLLEVAGPPAGVPGAPQVDRCTSFGVSGSVTLDGEPISGQTKDTDLNRIPRVMVLRMRIKDAPTILVLGYPGEILGHGMWSTGMSLYRNTLYSSAPAKEGLGGLVFGLLTLAGQSVHEATELARRYGRRGAGSILIADGNGESLSIETNVGGVSIIPQKEGIATHANHPEGEETRPYEQYPFPSTKQNSTLRHGMVDPGRRYGGAV